jgi:hypothetical protein
MRGLEATVLASLLLLSTAPVVFGQDGSCHDEDLTYTGTLTGGPEETAWSSFGAAPPAIDSAQYGLDLGSSTCTVNSVEVFLSSTTPDTDLDLYLSVDGFALDESAGSTATEHILVAGTPAGHYLARVHPWSAVEADYTLRVVADVGAAPTVSGPNAAKPFVVIAVVDTGINPYHDEFSEDSYPDSTVDLSAHPSTYIEEYPPGAAALNLDLASTDYGTAVSSDSSDWSGIVQGKLYWIPGTKIIGAFYSDNGLDGATAKILDSHGHGTRSAGVAVGNTLGSCGNCLLVVVHGTGGLGWAFSQPWIDFVSNSWGTLGNVGVPTAGIAPDPFGVSVGSRSAAERGQTVLFAAGNGFENGFLTPEPDYESSEAGPAWVMTVGAIWRQGSGAGTESIIMGSGKPVDVSSYGLGSIPAPNRATISGTGNHSGTSAATPIVAGVMGDSLLAARTTLGDDVGGNHGGVIAAGANAAGMLNDGELTRSELEDAIEYTAEHTNTNSIGISPLGPPTGQVPDSVGWTQWAAEGWGIVLPRTGTNAKAVIDGSASLPARSEDEFFAAGDTAVRELLWGPSP